MKERRCRNSGALLFTPEPMDNEIIQIKKENNELKDRLNIIEQLFFELKEEEK